MDKVVPVVEVHLQMEAQILVGVRILAHVVPVLTQYQTVSW